MPRCRKAETPSGASASSRAARETLPPDLLAAGVRRLGIVALLTAGIGIFFSVVMRVVAVKTGQTPYHSVVLFGEIASVLASLGIFGLTRRAGMDPAELLDRALVYEVAIGLLFAMTYHSIPIVAGVLPKGWSSVAVWVMAFPLLVPSTRGKTALATAATAAMDPTGLLVAIALGHQPAPPASVAVAMFLPTFVAAVIAIVGSRIVYRLSAQAGRAEELGSYRLVAPLGHGGMGEVWRAEHRMLARDAAIKLVRGRDGGIPRDLVARFEREAKATAGLRSPHTVQLYDFGRSDDGAFYYVMELLDGYTLDKIVERHGALAPERVVFLLRQACRSLAEAHAAGLVHRDIKPGNIFLCRYGGEADFVKVVDFGLVKDVSSSGGVNLTQTGLIAGTPAYMPPEMALGKDVDGRADLYSLGCVGYYLLTAHTVFDRTTALETLHDHTSTAPIPPSQRVATPIPADLEAVLLACLAKDPAGRPESARVLEERLAATTSAGRWSRTDAERWWERNSPATGAYRPLPTEPEGTRLETPEVRAAAGS
jgi:serine/threonine-protein kinase